MIYLDNAATGGFKTSEVINTMQSVTKFLCANPGRSGHALSLTGARIISQTRETLANAFNCSSDRVIFTKNCTEALNIAIFGSIKKGGHIITTVFEHNSVLRPLFYLEKMGMITLDIVEPEGDKNLTQAIAEKINDKTYLVVTTAISNVTGEELPITEIASLCKRRNLLFLCDGAQGGGHIPLSIKNQGISMLALAGHKGLYGVMGSGALLFSEDVELSPLTFGGTGTDSFSANQPDTYPEKLEAGTLNLPAIACFDCGAKYATRNLSHFSEQLFMTTKRIIDELGEIKNVKCYSMPNHAGIVAFNISGLDSGYVADTLNTDYDIAVRGGLHCAPLMHKYLRTFDVGGLVRASTSIQNTTREINSLIFAVKEIATRFVD